MSKGSIITLVVLVVMVIAGLFGVKIYHRTENEKEARTEAWKLVQDSKALKPHLDYLKKVMESHHTRAFSAAYSSGGLFAPSEFDGQIYVERIWELTAMTLRNEGKADIIELLPAVGGDSDLSR